MSRLYGDQLQSAGRRFYFALDGAPGIITPAPAVLTLNGRQPIAVEPLTVFRTPAPATLTLGGLFLGAVTVLTPAPAALSESGKIPSLVTQRTITPALPAPLETPPPAFVPTLITIWTTQPGVAQLSLQTLEINVTQGGNIGFVSPGAAQISLGTLPYSLLLGGVASLGQITVIGRAPTLLSELTIQPQVGQVSLGQLEPDLSLPFTWIDDDPAPAHTWITDAAA